MVSHTIKATRLVLDGELKRLTATGYGDTIQSKELSVNHEQRILDLCNPDTATGLLERVIIHIHKGFSLRGGAGYSLDDDEVVESVDNDGNRYFGWLPGPWKAM